MSEDDDFPWAWVVLCANCWLVWIFTHPHSSSMPAEIACGALWFGISILLTAYWEMLGEV